MENSNPSNPSDNAWSVQTAVKDQPIEDAEPSTHPSANRFTEVFSPTIQPSHTVQEEKEAAYTTEKQVVYSGAEKEPAFNPENGKEVHKREFVELPITTSNRRRTICGLPKKWCFGLIALVTCVTIALVVALGVVFGTRHS